MAEQLKPYRTRPPKAHHWKHGACARDERLYTLWATMVHRCYNPKRIQYKNYGGRGIIVCEEWHDPHNFIDWAISHGYKLGLQIDRADNDGNYSPENCRFVTTRENCLNRRNSKYLKFQGQRQAVSNIARATGISPYTIYYWIKEKGHEYAEKRISEHEQ